MPDLSRFLGMVIAMYHSDHPPPHFHVRYAEHRAKFTIEDCELITGYLPRRAMAFVREWHALHIDELRADWQLVMDRQAPNRIELLE